jgi:hypothetical protein
MYESDLRSVLVREFNATQDELEKVSRQALRLYQSGNFKEDTGNELTIELISSKLHEADRPITEGWNWWMGSLEYIHSGYLRFQI